MNPEDELPDTAFLLQGSLLRVRWMRYQGDFPARRFLETNFPGDIPQFLQRVKEMANFGRIRLRSHGHQLNGPYSALHQFNMNYTRSWGIRDSGVYVVLNAAKKRTTGQEPDYDKALELCKDYFDRLPR